MSLNEIKREEGGGSKAPLKKLFLTFEIKKRTLDSNYDPKILLSYAPPPKKNKPLDVYPTRDNMGIQDKVNNNIKVNFIFGFRSFEIILIDLIRAYIETQK